MTGKRSRPPTPIMVRLSRQLPVRAPSLAVIFPVICGGMTRLWGSCVAAIICTPTARPMLLIRLNSVSMAARTCLPLESINSASSSMMTTIRGITESGCERFHSPNSISSPSARIILRRSISSKSFSSSYTALSPSTMTGNNRCGILL